MAKIEFKGITEYSAKLNRLSALSRDKVIGAAVYDGAKIVADTIRQEIESLPTDEHWGTPDYPKAGPSQAEKDGLLESLGVTTIRDDNGFVNVKAGFDGYQGEPTAKYPKGKPNQMIARSINAGTSFMAKVPFMDRALRKCRKPAEAAMKNRVEKEIDKIMN